MKKKLISYNDSLENIIHEIRTPMNAILGFAEILLQGNTNEHQRNFLELIKSNAYKLQEAINDMLEIAELEISKDLQTTSESEIQKQNNILKHKNILIAEDNEVNRALMKEIMIKFECNCEMAKDGIEAYSKAISGNFDLILMDIQMPEMDGIEATQKLRDEGYKKPIIALTAHVTEEYVKEAQKAGMNDYLSKPVNRKILKATLAKHLQQETKTQKTENSTTIINKNKLLEYIENNLDFLKELSEVFSKKLPERLGKIRSSIEANNPDELMKTAHALKGAADIFHSEKISELIRVLEKSGRDGSTNKAMESFNQLEELFVRFNHELKQIISSS